MTRNRTEYLRQWRQDNEEHCREYATDYRETHREEKRVYSREYARRFRREVLEFFGNRCVRCGFDDPRALQLDHINGGGNREHQLTTGLYGIYRRALEHPEDFQLLCANCNNIKRYEAGEGVCLE